MKKTYLLILLLVVSFTRMYAGVPDDYVYNLEEPIEFTGSNFVDLGNSGDLEPGTGSFSIMFSMIAKKSSSNNQVIAAKGNAASQTSGWMAILGEGFLGFRIAGTNTSGNYRASARIPFPNSYLNKLVHVSATVDRETGLVDLYLNGSNNSTQYTGFGPTSNVIDAGKNITTTSPLYLGQRSDGGIKFVGNLASFAVYKRALTVAEIQSVMPAGLLSLNINGVDDFIFNPNQYEYNIDATKDTEQISLNCSFMGDVTVTLNDETLESEKNSTPVSLTMGEVKTLTLTIKNNSNNTTETYTFNITRTNQVFKKVNVFEAGKEGYHTYRIPAIIKAANGDLLAFCEGRKSGSGDAGNIDLVMKRSTDNGLSWSALELIVDYKDLLTSDGQTYGSLYGDYTVGNMAPVLDTMDPNYPNGRIILPFNTNGAQGEGSIMQGNGIREVWFITSDDNGETWSTPKNITTSVNRPNEPNFNPEYNFSEDWRWYAVTPGHAIQLKNSKYAGRMVFASNHSAGATGGTYFSHAFYTDDHGETWQLGSNVGANTNEATAAELSNGNVMINMRNYTSVRARAVATSSDGGESWKNLRRDAQLPEPISQGTILYNEDYKALHFANPASTTGRNNLAVRTSFDDGRTWAYKRTVERDDGAYADLVLQDDNKLGLLYETKGYTLINYAIMNNEWIEAGEKTSKTEDSGSPSNPLISLVFSEDVTGFNFDPEVKTYTLSAESAVASVKITPTAAAGTIYINGKPVQSGALSEAIELTPGLEEYINVTVTEIDKRSANYIIKLTRKDTNSNTNNISKEDFKCYPNPSKGTLFFQKPKNMDVSINVLDISGREMPFTESQSSIDLSYLENGLYLVLFNTPDSSFSQLVSLKK